MWPGMRPGDRVDRVVHLDAALLELVGQLADRVLRLRDRHAVAGHDDDPVGVGELDRHVGGVGGAHRLLPRRRRRAAVTLTPPKPPAKTLAIERFIASAISFVRIEPDAPTSMPATISAVLSSAMPAAAADRPVNAFSSEITTGMSAPPIGSTNMLPSSAAATRITTNRPSDSVPAAIAIAQPDGHDREQPDVDELLARAAGSGGPGSSPGASRTR